GESGIEDSLLRCSWLLARHDQGTTPASAAVTEEQRRQKPGATQPSGPPPFYPRASLFAPHRSMRIYSLLSPRPGTNCLAAYCILSRSLLSLTRYVFKACQLEILRGSRPAQAQ